MIDPITKRAIERQQDRVNDEQRKFVKIQQAGELEKLLGYAFDNERPLRLLVSGHLSTHDHEVILGDGNTKSSLLTSEEHGQLTKLLYSVIERVVGET